MSPMQRITLVFRLQLYFTSPHFSFRRNVEKKAMAIHLLCATHDFSDFYHISPPQSLYQVEEPMPTQILVSALPSHFLACHLFFLLLTFQG